MPSNLYNAAEEVEHWPYENFTREELSSKGDGSILVDHDAISRLQHMRDILGPLKINSAYRDPLHNKRVGGAKNSYHLKGVAFDISRKGYDLDEMLHAAKEVGFTGIGIYNGFIHVDTGPERSWRG